ncbi:hypothetical protein DP49_5311 [Burkholderia pseudomallei]|nr:hypothetical protein DO73_4636 [Burkholderia pseudomallei]KGD58138.1 hypothetical protein DP49_5311 [Burkholderia pseudomallei]
MVLAFCVFFDCANQTLWFGFTVAQIWLSWVAVFESVQFLSAVNVELNAA